MTQAAPTAMAAARRAVRPPCITSQFQPRKAEDRPPAVPNGPRNFAFLRQYTKIPEDVVFTVEHSVLGAMHAVYQLRPGRLQSRDRRAQDGARESPPLAPRAARKTRPRLASRSSSRVAEWATCLMIYSARAYGPWPQMAAVPRSLTMKLGGTR